MNAQAITGELTQILKQHSAAALRHGLADLEYNNQIKQIEQAKELHRFFNEDDTDKYGKTSNKALYTWMQREVRGLYTRCFQFAFDTAKQAERALQHELGDHNLTFLKYDYQSGKEGLLAGDKLFFDVKRMEEAFLRMNKREKEQTVHLSLLQLDPAALIQLKQTGRCEVEVPEAAIDLEFPGHYFRRIKSVAVTVHRKESNCIKNIRSNN